MKKNFKIIGFFVMMLTSPNLLAFKCYLTVMKDSCWANYSTTVAVKDAQTHQTYARIIIGEGSTWGRQSFNCDPGQELMFEASFFPVFWKSDEGKTYQGMHFWKLPESTTDKEVAWNISLCFSSQFAEVPFPPDAKGNCHCDASGIPAIGAN